jgi:hypothetical protein
MPEPPVAASDDSANEIDGVFVGVAPPRDVGAAGATVSRRIAMGADVLERLPATSMATTV